MNADACPHCGMTSEELEALGSHTCGLQVAYDQPREYRIETTALESAESLNETIAGLARYGEMTFSVTFEPLGDRLAGFKRWWDQFAAAVKVCHREIHRPRDVRRRSRRRPWGGRFVMRRRRIGRRK